MKRLLKNSALAVLALVAVSCTGTIIKGDVEGLKDSDLVVKKLDVTLQGRAQYVHGGSPAVTQILLY